MKQAHSIAQLCSAFAVTRSGYHTWQAAPDSRRRLADAALLGDIQQIHAGHRGRYGAPRIQQELGGRGARHGTKRIARLMRLALTHRRPPRGVLHHSDRGVQYASAEHRAVLAAAGLQPSMSAAGNPCDNATMESFMATYKRECVGLAEEAGGYTTRSEATADFFSYAESYYNLVRLHSALGYQSPVDFERQLN